MHEPTRDLVLFVFGMAIVTGTLVVQYIEPAVSPWPGLVVGSAFLLGAPVSRAILRGIARAVSDAENEESGDG